MLKFFKVLKNFNIVGDIGRRKFFSAVLKIAIKAFEISTLLKFNTVCHRKNLTVVEKVCRKSPLNNVKIVQSVENIAGKVTEKFAGKRHRKM